ncbi:MAG: hypothetical protein DMH00_09400 [Acidobacteria bacterium]|nr:MAG: hypothetical protein DMH00_09400 [Acidobacteriota bacterium]
MNSLAPSTRDLSLLALASALALVPYWAIALPGAMALALFLPGHAFLQCFTPRRPGGSCMDLTLAAGLSLAISPLALRLAGLVLPFKRPAILGILIGVSTLLILASGLRRRPVAGPPSPRTPRAVLAMVLFTAALLVPTLAIGPAPDSSETRIKGWDLHNHLAVAEAITARGLPPTNPFLFSSSPFYYHTFFHILLASLLKMAGPRAPSYFVIAVLTVLLAVLCLATFYWVVADLTGRPRMALMALPFLGLVGGYDLFPILLKASRSAHLSPLEDLISQHWNVDAWVSHQKFFVPAFFTQYYWAPHAVAGATALLLALLFLEKEDMGRGGFVAAGICLAAMAGFNGYIALGGAATVALLRAVGLLGHFAPPLLHRRASLARSALAGTTALLLGWPVLSLYFGERGNVDKFRLLEGGPFLPLQVILEFGPALLLGAAGMVWAWKRPERRKGTMPFLLMGAAGLPMICLVASTGENNDLAMRVSMLVWFSLAAFAGLAIDLAWAMPWARRAALVLLVPGVLGTLWFVIGASVGKPTLPGDEVAVGNWMRRHLPPGTLIQGSPYRHYPDLVYLSGHPAYLSDAWAARLFYSVPEDFSRNLAALEETFQTEDSEQACPKLKALGIAALVVGPAETSDFPLLARPLPWSCLTQSFRRGTYRVFLVRS